MEGNFLLAHRASAEFVLRSVQGIERGDGLCPLSLVLRLALAFALLNLLPNEPLVERCLVYC